MFIKRSKYEVEKVIAQQRIRYLEHIICPKGHDYVDIGTKITARSMYGDLYQVVYVCSRCGKIKEWGG